MKPKIHDEQQNKQTQAQLRAKLRETLSIYAQGIPVNIALSELQTLGNELTEIALQTTDCGEAISNFSVNFHGVVQEAGE